MTVQKSMRKLAGVLAVVFVATTTPLPAAAAMVSNETALTQHQVDRTELKAFFDRKDVIEAMQEQGVTSEMAKRRVDSMTDAEAQQLAAHIESEPAGAGVIGVLFTVFIVLLVTDILGLTKVFPFTRPVR